ncbi:caspase-8 [Sphaeramia orbicularis]|uniref:Caspase-8 n=1 Tax=Sphaeramia orbicularis TaxID=375764 RepID=A0A673BE27_9TELE|nr:caspase-8-like [Sphaeramia orbicularis]
MDFQRLLLQVGKALRRDEVRAMVFLCTDHLNRNLTSVDSSNDLFSCLVDEGLLSQESPDLLVELLTTIQRTRLLRELRLTERASMTADLISPYRKLLYNLSESLTEEDLRNIKFLLKDDLPRRKLEENVTTLEVFMEMEHQDLLGDTNLDLLQRIIESVCPMLKEKIICCKEQQAIYISSTVQQMRRPRSMSCPSDQTQDKIPKMLVCGRSASNEMSELPPLSKMALNSSNTSVDFTSRFNSGDSGVFSHELSDLSSCASSKDESDTFGVSPEDRTSKDQTFTKVQLEAVVTMSEGLGTYPMTGVKRGICLIINNYDFSNSIESLKMREGTKYDLSSLGVVFEWLGFDIEVHNNCTREQMLTVVRQLSSRDHSQMDCVVCCILSHGLEGGVYGVDGRPVKLMELTEPFNGSRCPSLVEKPKLFFIQACQGTIEQKAVVIQTDGPEPTMVCCDAVQIRESIPCDADFLQALATVPSFVSYRERTHGTWFIQTLCQNLVQMVPRGYDLVSILTKVNADVSQRTDSKGEKKQMPQPAFSLRKKVIFPIPTARPPSLLH